jgi:hypothetical protein
MNALLNFLGLALRVAPPLLWWAMGGLVFSGLNIALHHELWPNTPVARPIFSSLLLACALLMPWLAARTAWGLADAVNSYFWKAVWRFMAVAGYVGAALASVVGVVTEGFMWHGWLSAH